MLLRFNSHTPYKHEGPTISPILLGQDGPADTAAGNLREQIIELNRAKLKFVN